MESKKQEMKSLGSVPIILSMPTGSIWSETTNHSFI